MAATILLSSVSFAKEAVEIRADQYSCQQISNIIQREGKVFVRMAWFAGRSFRYPPYRCDIGDKYQVVSFRAKEGEPCRLGYACVTDPSFPGHRN